MRWILHSTMLNIKRSSPHLVCPVSSWSFQVDYSSIGWNHQLVFDLRFAIAVIGEVCMCSMAAPVLKQFHHTQKFRISASGNKLIRMLLCSTHNVTLCLFFFVFFVRSIYIYIHDYVWLHIYIYDMLYVFCIYCCWIKVRPNVQQPGEFHPKRYIHLRFRYVEVVEL